VQQNSAVLSLSSAVFHVLPVQQQQELQPSDQIPDHAWSPMVIIACRHLWIIQTRRPTHDATTLA
jgi:hypothetical protein